MPYLEMDSTAGKKRKRASKPTRPAAKAQSKQVGNQEIRVLELENQIFESRKHYNNIVTLLSTAKESSDAGILSCVALCRVYARLYASGSMRKSKAKAKGMSEAEVVIVQWLTERLNEYVDLLLDLLGGEASGLTALTLLMRLVREEVNQRGQNAWTHGTFAKVVHSVLNGHLALRQEFEGKYFSEYADIRFHTLGLISLALKDSPDHANVLASGIQLLLSLTPPTEETKLTSFYASSQEKNKHSALNLSSHKKDAQAAWLSILSSPALTKDQRKSILTSLVPTVIPWFHNPTLLMDQLSDSFDLGGATSLLSLSGLFYLMQERNLDYPSFYTKLYSLLDGSILHSKHRSRFFRLLETFMASTHLPAALVASFIKRLARLALHAPPAGIVVVIPWIYNMFKLHSQCTFMIHRLPRTTPEKFSSHSQGFADPFIMTEKDPLNTNAIDSSIWEIHTLQDHYHPNVASLARIIGEPFTKERYNLEDFLDHSYASLIGAEVGKEMKRTPEVEYQIPKYVFGGEIRENNVLAGLMQTVISSS
ncbi:CBF-domain-containing protein [Tothia fuscella]|uniref:CBF-domain-containing protein n=1 Tax=Tothia fuscella TaxID=1048955 RepID=A0A9P4TRM5_9PEZI|nr:CBF-domain-containing protein [Tothia fuscella]